MDSSAEINNGAEMVLFEGKQHVDLHVEKIDLVKKPAGSLSDFPHSDRALFPSTVSVTNNANRAPAADVVLSKTPKLDSIQKEGLEALITGKKSLIEFSFFVEAIRLMSTPASGSFMSGFENGIGFLMLAGSPVLETLRVAFGTVSTVAGTVVYGGASCLKAGDWVGRQLFSRSSSSSEIVVSLAEAEQKKRHLAQLFVVRLYDSYKKVTGLTIEQRTRLLDHPEILAAWGALSVAFYSRHEATGVLKTMDGALLNLADLSGLTDDQKRLFSSVVALKDALKEVSLPASDAEAWKIIHNYLGELVKVLLGVDTQASTLPLCVIDIVKYAATVGEVVVADPCFKEEWAALRLKLGR